MKIQDHPPVLTRDAIKKWLDVFKKKLKRETTRNDLDRLILSVERMELEDEKDIFKSYHQRLSEVIFEKVEGAIQFKAMRYDRNGRKTSIDHSKKWTATELQRKILEQNPQYKDKDRIKIEQSKLQRENGKWNLDGIFCHEEIISEGGEAIVFNQTIGNLKVAVRVQCFDPALFTEGLSDDELFLKINISKEYEIAKGNKSCRAQKDSIPSHRNVLKHYSNIEIFLQDDKMKLDCLGWITVMEKCDGNLKDRLKNGNLSIEERKKFLFEIKDGLEYLSNAGIEQLDAKPENILFIGDVPKLCDFGVVLVENRNKSYEEMGYSPRGSKYRQIKYIQAGTAAYTTNIQQLLYIHKTAVNFERIESPIHVWLLCDWNTAWYLLFKPIETGDERKHIRNELKKFNAESFHIDNGKVGNCFTREMMQNVSNVISVTASDKFVADDPNITKSTAMSNVKQNLTIQMNNDFVNVTKRVIDQKDTYLCVPISVTTLLRWALKHDLKKSEEMLNNDFSIERIVFTIAMIIYPRSITGLNLNPKEEKKEFQRTKIETLLKRLKFRTYLNSFSGWEIINSWHVSCHLGNADFNYELVLLHDQMDKIDRPLTVTGAIYDEKKDKVFFHQMVVDKIEQKHYVLQNTDFKNYDSDIIRIPVSRKYYVDEDFIQDCFDYYKDKPYRYVYLGDNHRRKLVHENHNKMKMGQWYLCLQAYSITLTPK